MHPRTLAILASAYLAGSACSSGIDLFCQDAIACRVEQLDHDFAIVVRSMPVENTIESVGHFSYLFYRDRELGRVGQSSISPSGRYALYESVGHLLLFDTETLATVDVTDGTFSIPSVIEWDEVEQQVVVE